jgi:DNA-binding CsgD family transcriptional regulator
VTGPKLTDLETSVLRHAAEGRTIEATGRLLGKSMPAVQDARHRLMGKLGAASLAQAVLLACRAGILDGRPRQQRHGDHPGYTTHQKRGEEACNACKAGERAYQTERRQRRRQERADGAVSALEAARGARDVRDAARAAGSRSGDPGEAAA